VQRTENNSTTHRSGGGGRRGGVEEGETKEAPVDKSIAWQLLVLPDVYRLHPDRLHLRLQLLFAAGLGVEAREEIGDVFFAQVACLDTHTHTTHTTTNRKSNKNEIVVRRSQRQWIQSQISSWL
jgi:hypothetical protein